MDSNLHKRATLLCIGFVACMSLLSVRLVYLHVVMHERYAAIAESQHVHKEVLEAKRGTIVDRNGELLARNQTIYTVVADQTHLADYNIACRGLAAAEGITGSEVRRKYDREEIKERYLNRVVRVLAQPLDYSGMELSEKLSGGGIGEVILKKNVEEDACAGLKDLVGAEQIGGVYFRRTARRFYPSPQSLTHVLGFVDHEGEGREGIEKSMGDVMRGVDGFRFIERDRRHEEIAAYRGETQPARDGKNVRLTIDMGLQNIVEEVLSDAWYQYLPEKISAIFLDPATGEILAMANRPHFDLTTREGERRNSAIADNYEPGSTFKIVATAAAFERKLVSRDTRIFCHFGTYQDGGFTINDHHPYGELTVTGVIAKSSNIGTYKIAAQLGRDGFHEYMLKFGFGEPTGITLPGESGGVVYSPRQWSAPSFSRMAIGYEVAVTPLQVASALGAIANGGFLMKPYVVDAILDDKGREIEKFRPQVVRRVVSERAANEVRKCLVEVMGPDGTGENGAVEGCTVAGNTGTARKYSTTTHQYLSGRYVVSFMGFLPAENPRLLGIVVVDDPQTGVLNRYGGTVAAPVFSRIATEAVAYMNLEENATSPAVAGTYRGD